MKRFRFPFKAMGTPCEMQLYAPSGSAARRVANNVQADIERLEARYSRYRDSSFLSEMNRIAAKGGTVKVDAETASLLDYAQTCFNESDGLFDITSGLLRQAWNFRSETLPSDAHIQSLLGRIGWQRLEWEAPVLSFPHAGMEIDLGGVVKEYAVDRAATLCQEQGIHHGMVNLGGDIRVIGPHADGSPWQVAIRHPRDPDGLLTTLSLASGALASSGDYERCLTIDGVRYGHVLNPKTGWPVTHMAAVSVVADLCVVAGSASTIGMLRDEAGKTWLADAGVDYLWVDVEGQAGGSLLE